MAARHSCALLVLAAGVVAALTGFRGVAGVAVAHAAAPRAIRVGGFPTGITYDPGSDTVYVENGTSGTLSLIDARSCNAGRPSGCRAAISVAAGVDPVGSAVDEATGTLYLADAAGTVAVVDERTCDAADRAGCRIGRVAVPVGVDPQFLAVDAQTDTVYVANTLSNSVSVIAGRRCNADSTSGCRRVRASIPVGPGPFALALDDATDSLYVTDLGSDTVSIIDGATCNATDVRGCWRPPVTVAVGRAPGGIALDPRTDTLYVTGESSADVTVIDGLTCNARTTVGCRTRPLAIRAGAGARGVAIDEATDTVYVADTAANAVSVIDGASCNAAVHSGCEQLPPLVPVGLSPRRLAVDEGDNTIFVTNAGSNTVTMLDGASCDGRVHSGCGGPAAAGSAGARGSARRSGSSQPALPVAALLG